MWQNNFGHSIPRAYKQNLSKTIPLGIGINLRSLAFGENRPTGSIAVLHF